MENKHLHVPGAALAWPPETHRTCSAEHHFPRHCSPADSCMSESAIWVRACRIPGKLDLLNTNLPPLQCCRFALRSHAAADWVALRACAAAACSMCAAAVFRMIGTFSGRSDLNFQMFRGR